MSGAEPPAPDGAEEASYWDTTVGPILDDQGAQALTGLAPEELASHVESGAVLAVVTSDGVSVIPAFQFGPLGELLPEMRSVARLLGPMADDSWDKALWLRTRSRSFNGLSAAELLRAGETEKVLSAAMRDGSIMSC